LNIKKRRDKMPVKMIQRIMVLPLVLMLLIALSSSHSQGAEKPKGKTKKSQTSKQKQPSSETKPIEKFEANQVDLACTALPKNYTGHDLVSIFNALKNRKISAQKGEYETTEQYKQRVQNEEQKPLIGLLGVNDIFSFVVNPESKYNADSQTLTIVVKTTGVLNGFKTDNSRAGILGPTLYYKKSTYMGSNAFGASTEIEKILMLKVVLAFSNISALPLDKPTYGEKNIEFKLENIKPEIAKVIREQLQVAFIYKLEEPYHSVGSMIHEPTRDEPRDSSFIIENVLATSKAIWVFNKVNGEILLKVKVD
jgi:hypothetical protein